MICRKLRRVSRCAICMSLNFTRTVGLLVVETPLVAIPFTQICPLATHKPTSKLTPEETISGVCTWHPPRLALERLPQTGVREPSILSSTAIKHFIRGCLRRSSAHKEEFTSGWNGGAVNTPGAPVESPEAAVVPVPLCLISRRAASRTSSRVSTGASPYSFNSFVNEELPPDHLTIVSSRPRRQKESCCSYLRGPRIRHGTR